MSIFNVISITTLGTFDVETGRVIVSDPCYDKGTWCAAEVPNVRNGTYTASIIKSDEGDWGVRVKELHAYHDSSGFPGAIDPVWERLDDSIGVDSGQAGIFDEKYYDNDELLPENYTYTVSTLRHDKGYKCTDGVIRSFLEIRDIVEGMSNQELLEHDLCKLADPTALKRILRNMENDGSPSIFNFVVLDSDDDHTVTVREEVTTTINKDTESSYGDTIWYSICCDNTLGEEGGGTIPYGCVSRSGYGDGGYSAYIVKDNDEIVGFKIVYIGDEEEDEDF
jgi:hypothetical protein